MTLEEVFAKLPGAREFMEIPDDSVPLGAAAVVIDSDGTAWEISGKSPRPISPKELHERGAFACKPEDVAELIPDFSP